MLRARAFLLFILFSYLGLSLASLDFLRGPTDDGAFIKTDPLLISDASKPVLVRYGGVTPQPEDILKIVMAPRDAAIPASSNPTAVVIGYYKISEIPGWMVGSAEVSVPLYHPRDNAFYFEYFAKDPNGDKKHPLRFVVSSPAILALQPEYASQLHLALTHHPDEMLLSYTTLADPAAAQFVQYSTTSFKALTSEFGVALDRASADGARLHLHKPFDPAAAAPAPTDRVRVVHQVPAVQDSTYTVADMASAPANNSATFISPGNFREALMAGLAPATKYHYRIVDATGAPLSAEHSFLSSPGVGAGLRADVFALGDLGVGSPYYNEDDSQPPAAETVRNIAAMLDERRVAGTEVPSMLLHIGDISYARGRHYMWEVYAQQIEPVVASIPYMVSIGNHEYDYPAQPWKPSWSDYGDDSGGEAGVPFYTRYHMPLDFATAPYPPTNSSAFAAAQATAQSPLLPATHASAPGSPPLLRLNGDVNAALRAMLAQQTAPAPAAAPSAAYQARLREGRRHTLRAARYDGRVRNLAYSFEYGPVHFLIFSAEHDFTPGSQQYAFIEEDLKAVNRSRTPWVIAASHRPPYCSSAGCSLYQGHANAMDTQLRVRIEPLLVKYEVDLGLFGHVHTYERTCHINNYKCDDSGKAPVHVVIGMAGHIFNEPWAPFSDAVDRDGKVSSRTPLKSLLHHNQPDWSIFRSMTYGFTHFTANATNLDFKFIGNKARSVHDQFTLTKKP